MNSVSNLNRSQQDAVEAIDGPVLVLAGPGSGKTRVITQRIAYLVKTCGISPRHILAVTFTNKAAKEMADRLEAVLGTSGKELTLGTFHAICVRILRQDGEEIGIHKGFTIYDDDDQISLMKRAIVDVGLDPKQYTPRTMLTRVSNAKSQLITPEMYSGMAHSYFEKMAQQCYQRYQVLLAQSRAVDFDDILMKTVELFRERPDILGKYQSRFRHVLVDEFQDTNVTQYELTKQFAGKYRNICVVGDPDQSIYTWRQADIRNILRFEEDYPGAKTVVLEQNYRSTKTILAAADKVISRNQQRKQKGLWTENEKGSPITVLEMADEQEEARFVVSEVEKLVKEQVVSLKDCVALYRVNAQSRALEEAFLRFGLPYRLVGGTRFYQRREVKDIVAYLRLVHNPHDTVSFRRVVNVPQRGIGQRTLDDFLSWAKQKSFPVFQALSYVAMPDSEVPLASRTRKLLAEFYRLLNGMVGKSRELKASDMLEMVIEQTGYERYLLLEEDGEDRWENIKELLTVARKCDHLDAPDSLTAFLEEVSLVSDIDSYDEKADAVTLTTLHQAKGLEFGAVFMVGMEEKIFPHARALPPLGDPTEMEEERRLCYVGITRAKKRLYLLRAARRTYLGSTSNNLPSRFLEDIPNELVVKIGSRPEAKGLAWAASMPWKPLSQLEASIASPSRNVMKLDLKSGDRVKHEKFGNGIVVSTSPLADDYQVTVAFEAAGIKKLILGYARLERMC